MAIYQIVSHKFVAGIVTSKSHLVTNAAPIVYYMIGWHISKVRQHCQIRQWTIYEI